MPTMISRECATRWAARCEAHMPAVEPRLFDEVGPAVRARGYYQKGELVEVARWKTHRTQSRIAGNNEQDVRDLTRVAFAAPERFQHQILSLLDGVEVPTATALLTVAFPDRHSIRDRRTREALLQLDRWAGTGGYSTYLKVCRQLATDLDVTLRALDRALWQWSKAGYPQCSTDC